jgi:hypothetical protein
MTRRAFITLVGGAAAAGPRERHMGLTGLMGARLCSGSPYTSTSSEASYPSSSYKQPFRSS